MHKQMTDEVSKVKMEMKMLKDKIEEIEQKVRKRIQVILLRRKQLQRV